MSVPRCPAAAVARLTCALILVSGAGSNATALQTPADTTNKLPIRTSKLVSFTTDEGTWISLDVSPDGKSIVFDLLGDIYVVPVEGGEAKRLTSGNPWDAQPAYSPDGTEIAFISDRSGSKNVWIMKADGSGLDKLTSDPGDGIKSPAWVPTEDFLAFSGGYGGLSLIHRKVRQPFALNVGSISTGASFSSDGRMVYFSGSDGGYGGRLSGNQAFSFDRVTGKRERLTNSPGGGLRPIVSPDGKYLVYATRRDAGTALRLRYLASGKDEWLVTSTQKDDAEGFAAGDYYPRYSFTPDSRSVVYTDSGKIKRVDVATKKVATIPFSAKVEIPVANRLRVEYRAGQGDLEVRQMYWMNASPDGRQVTFSAVGKVWAADLATGQSRRLTDRPAREYAPAFSPDGKWIAFISLTDTGGAAIVKVPAAGGKPVAITPAGGHYKTLTWSATGDKVLYMGRRVAPDECLECDEFGWIPADGGESHHIDKSTRSWYAHGEAYIAAIRDVHGDDRLYFNEGGSVVSIKLDGTDRRTVAQLGGADVGAVVPSPDGKYLLFTDHTLPYLVELPEIGSPITVSLGGATVPFKKLSEVGGYSLGWADGGKTVTWSFTNKFYRLPLAEALRDSTKNLQPKETLIALTVPRARPNGTILFTGARLITMRGDEVIENGAILVENDRIAAIGKAGDIGAPAGAKVIDVKGKTIIPGFVDIHSEPLLYPAIAPQEDWEAANYLAYGVTTIRQPFASRVLFWWSELVEAGEVTGPRIFAVGRGLTTSAAPINSYEDALKVVRRYQSQGATSLKQYMQPKRIQRQWLRMAAESLHINVTNEGGGDLALDLSFAIDGMTGTEHNLPIVPIYRDVVQLLAQTGITYTTTLIVNYGGPTAETYWGNKYNIHDDDKARRFFPHWAIDVEFRRHEAMPDDEFNFFKIARGIRDVVRAGGHAGLGSHGAMPGGSGGQDGLGAHWELWSIASGGMTPLEALRVATLFGAESIGLDRDVGSLDVGKMADLLVLDGNPLDDLRNTNTIRYVVKGGVVHDGHTLDEIWPRQRKFPPFRWTAEDEAYRVLENQR